jgi:hypothetical protein
MTDSEKLLAVVDKCKEWRQQSIDNAAQEISEHGWNAETAPYEIQFNIAGRVLELAGHTDDRQWLRDALGVRT